MAILQDVSDAIKAISETIDSVQTLAAAIKDGRDYLKSKHPHVATDLVQMCVEMQKSSHALATASAIVTHFRFVVGETNGTEAARFNQHLIDHKLKAEHVEHQLQTMRGHCSIIAQHVKQIRENADPRGFTTLAAVLGLHSADKEHALAHALENIYNEEMQYHLGVHAMADAIRTALSAVEAELGPPGIIDPQNIPQAAVTLGEYAVAFGAIEKKCKQNGHELQLSIDHLQNRLP